MMKALMIGVGALALAGCTAVAPAQPPASTVALPQRFDTASGGVAEAADWWQGWHDPAMAQLIERALAANPDLRSAAAHLAEARANTSVARSALMPTVAAEGGVWEGAVEWRNSPAWGLLLPGVQSDGAANGHLAGLVAMWEPDVFGRANANLRASRFAEQAAAAQERGARLLVAAHTAQAYQDLRGAERRLVVLEEAMAASARLAAYTQARFAAGQASAADVARARAAAAHVAAAHAPLQAQAGAYRRRLAVLMGLPPETPLDLGSAAPLAVPPAPGGLLPSSLIERRPDVAARTAVVRARTEHLTALRGELLPHFSVEFLGQDGHLRISGLPTLGGTGGLVALDASLPLFTAGRIRAHIRAGDAQLEQAAADYDKALLAALESVENAYAARAAYEAQGQRLSEAERLAEARAADQARLYAAGRATLDAVLSAQIEAAEARDARIEADTARADAAIALSLALGG